MQLNFKRQLEQTALPLLWVCKTAWITGSDLKMRQLTLQTLSKANRAVFIAGV